MKSDFHVRKTSLAKSGWWRNKDWRQVENIGRLFQWSRWETQESNKQGKDGRMKSNEYLAAELIADCWIDSVWYGWLRGQKKENMLG